MTLRRIAAGFFVFLFIIVAIPTFFMYALSRNFFSGNFYRGPVLTSVYPSFVEIATTHFYNFDPIIPKYFDKNKVKIEIEKAVTPEILKSIAGQFGDQIEKMKQDPNEPGIINTKLIREGLLSASNNLAYQLFERIPLCITSELPEINIDGIPTCIPPQNADYAEISGPLSKQFEKAIYSFFPEQIHIDLRNVDGQSGGFYFLFAFLDSIKMYLLAGLVLLMAIIALIVYHPVALMLYYQALSLIVSGFFGILLGISIEMISPAFIQNVSQEFWTNKVDFRFAQDPETLQSLQQGFTQVLNTIVTSMIGDIQKISLAFLLLGVTLFFLHLFLKRKPLQNL